MAGRCPYHQHKIFVPDLLAGFFIIMELSGIFTAYQAITIPLTAYLLTFLA